MPRGILDVIRVDRSMRLELAATVGKAARVVQRNATLPELWRLGRQHVRKIVEGSSGRGETSRFEFGNGAAEQRVRTLCGNGGQNTR